MILTAAPPARINLRVLFRWLVTACALAGALAILVPPIPAQALESQAYGNVDVKPGEVRDEVYTTFGNVSVLGTVEGDVKTGSGDVLIDGPVEGDVKTGTGNVRVESPVKGDVKTGFGNVSIDAPVEGDVDVGQGNVHLGPNARIAGDVLCASGNIDPHSSAVVGGEMISGMNSDFRGEPPSRLLGFVGWILGALALMGGTVLAAVLMPGVLGSVARQVETAPVLSLALGAVSLPVAVVFVIILAVSIIGSPLIIFFLPAYGALVLFGAVAVSFFVGRRLLFATGRYRGGNALAAIVGALLVAAASAIPFVGPLLSFLLVSLGLGATILALVARRRAKTPPSYEAYVEDPGSVRG